jgi:hypothetical protein
MGISTAIVRCNCFAEGKSSDPPVPHELISADRLTGSLSLRLPHEGHELEWRAFHRWRESSCVHSDGEYLVCENFSTRAIEGLVDFVGEQMFPNLSKCLPKDISGGVIPVSECSRLMVELQQLRAWGHLWTEVLLQSESGRVFQVTNRNVLDTRILTNTSCVVRLWIGGLSIFAAKTGESLFCSSHFVQQVQQSDIEAARSVNGGRGRLVISSADQFTRVTLTDIQTGQKFCPPFAFPSLHHVMHGAMFRESEEFHVMATEVHSSSLLFSFEYDELEKALRASLVTGYAVEFY